MLFPYWFSQGWQNETATFIYVVLEYTKEITNDELKAFPSHRLRIDISLGGDIDMWILLFDS